MDTEGLDTKNPGASIEAWVCYGMPTEPLTQAEREVIANYADGFEECDESHEELLAMDDHCLIRVAYSAMSEYARGQM